MFNPELFLRRHTDPYSILTAMRGLDVVDVQVPHDPRLSPRFGALRSGPRKKMTATDNTSTSAIACPVQVAGHEWHVDLFHNRHAARSFQAASLAGAGIKHWIVADDERDWIPLSQP